MPRLDKEKKEKKEVDKKLEKLRELELLSMQEEFLKDEQRHLKSEYIRSKEEVRNPKFG